MYPNNNDLLSTYVICLIVSFAVSPISSDQNVYSYDKTTHGEVWPKPVNQLSYAEYMKFEPENFRFNVRSKIFKIYRGGSRGLLNFASEKWTWLLNYLKKSIH